PRAWRESQLVPTPPSSTVRRLRRLFRRAIKDQTEPVARSTSVWPTLTVYSTTTPPLLFLRNWQGRILSPDSIGACRFSSDETCLPPLKARALRGVTGPTGRTSFRLPLKAQAYSFAAIPRVFIFR